MSAQLTRLAEQLSLTMADALPELEVAEISVLPRGARPLAGLGRPLLVSVTRWPAVPPSGVVLAGEPHDLAAVLGVSLPEERAAASDSGERRRATDVDPEADADADADGDAAPGEGDRRAAAPAAADGDDEAPAPARRWTDRAAEAITAAAAELSASCVATIAGAVGLPAGVTDTLALHAERDIDADDAIGVVPEAFAIDVRRGEARARVIVVVGVLVSARLMAGSAETGSDSGPAAAPAEGAPDDPAPAPARHPSLAAIPLAVQARVGRAALPLRSVMGLQPGAVVELDATPSADVELVAGGVTLAHGSLQLDDDGLLEFEVMETTNAMEATS